MRKFKQKYPLLEVCFLYIDQDNSGVLVNKKEFDARVAGFFTQASHTTADGHIITDEEFSQVEAMLQEQPIKYLSWLANPIDDGYDGDPEDYEEICSENGFPSVEDFKAFNRILHSEAGKILSLICYYWFDDFDHAINYHFPRK